MNNVIDLNLWQFSSAYLFLFFILGILKYCKISQTKLLFIASIRMTVQLVLAGVMLTYIFKNPSPLYVILYIMLMMAMAIHTVLSRNKGINRSFALIVSLSLVASGALVLFFFISSIVGVSFFNPQYTIPLSGMIMGNAMTGVSLGLKTFHDNLNSQRTKIEVLMNVGVSPQNVLMPIVSKSLETALLPTLNSMLGMGIVSLPGMMTGQLLSGTLPTTAIMYQIAILLAITTVVCLSVFTSLYFGSRTLYNAQNQIILEFLDR